MRKHLWWIKPWLAGMLAVLSLATCKTGEKPTSAEAEKEEVSSETIVVMNGDSSMPSYSPDGKRLLFVSRNRKGHAHGQVYEKDLNGGAERRITFQNGNTAFPRFHPREDFIMYSSSTDELKEDPPMLKTGGTSTKLPMPYTEPYELYIHSLKGLEINRITRHQGFDGEGRFTANGAEVYWTRVDGGKPVVVSAPRGSNNAKPVKGVGKNSSQYSLSPDGKTRAWIQWADDYASSKIFLAAKKDAHEIASTPAFKTDLTFSPDGKHLLWAQAVSGSPRLEIWGFEIETACARKLVSGAYDRRHPVVSPDLKWLTFTSWRKDRSRIAQVAYQPAAGPCTPAP
jgi:Tol biopolymer transport system component